MRPTVKDVAAQAGVSPKTVSNVLTGTAFVRPATRERVEAAIEDLGYVPNFSARGLRNGRSGVVALALPDLSTPYSAEFAHHFVEVAHGLDWAVHIEETAAEPRRERDLLSRARSHLVDGLVLNPVTLADSAVAESADTDGVLPPTVIIGEVVQDRVDQVQVDSVGGARDMTEHLLARGARRIAVVGAPTGLDTAAARQRTDGYREALRRAGVAWDPALEIGVRAWRAQEAVAAVDRALELPEPPDAYFCFTDSLAVGALNALWRRGVRVPDDVLVAGFDDVADGRLAVPPLTTVAFDKRELAVQALTALAVRIDDPDAPRRSVVVPHAVVGRASTGAPGGE
ncbi:LacI family DNA-binding transcriptional regulator [Cellulomonas sp. PhB143]|uniref:LacI family DNA-binding transcriptional regulator n=1 Tax=Cellulomonas sp. PhB143 TaxID=2485186 RepID=UPI000F4AC41A|nr:LacI family DNA-binding transcriptional regulator [Cellulomonas sp. PhB143]ROS76494.1 LacI family transcriptional regulator [Cellulomonas sp. PhB143]